MLNALPYKPQVESQLSSSHRKLELLSHTASQLLLSSDPQLVVDPLCREVLTYLGCDVFINYLLDEKTGYLHLNACGGIPETVARELEWLQPGSMLCGCVARDGVAVVAEDIQHTRDPRAETVRSMGVQAYACNPLRSHERVIGTLSFGSRTNPRFAEDDVDLMRTVADHVSIALERKLLYEAAERRANEAEESRRILKLEQLERERLLVSEQQARAQLESAVNELEAFSYSISHDLRAPLRAVEAFSSILAAEYSAPLPPEAKRYLGLVRESSKRMDRLITDLLAFSRLSRQPLSRQKIDLAQLCREVAQEMALLCQNRAVRFTFGSLPVCRADGTLIRQVLMNLISNSIKYTSGRDVALIEIGSVDVEGTCAVYVRDNGIGFKMKYANKLFGVFQRLHSDDQYEGSGVGLAIVQRIITRHGGEVWAEAVEGGGATFYFTLGEECTTHRR